ncbi:testis-specific serine/threonine-protein kinase 3 [Prorops nasuta]|uniref:testis-specific serine/threonine-protein kinase 3 n=1 Tax=Prorops nasuta TaxID=863751 RepID=UPI0034CF8B42
MAMPLSASKRLSPRNSEVNALEQRGYIIGKKIGQGSYATVHLAEYVDGTSRKKMRLACKIFDKKEAPSDFLEKFFPRELEILTKIENPHIIQVHSILQRGPRVFIFMRFADNGDLLDFVKRNGAVPEQQSKLWFRQMASGLHYLHSKNIAHRDLKCENILLSRRFNVKLADFGFARFCVDSDGRRVLSQTYCGSAAYAAPEVVSGTPYNPKLADVWSLGIILFIILNGSMPFDDANHRRLLKDQMSRNWFFRSRVRDTLSVTAKNIVKHILEPDITLRFTLERVLAHEWVRAKKDKSSTHVGRLVHSAPPFHQQGFIPKWIYHLIKQIDTSRSFFKESTHARFIPSWSDNTQIYIKTEFTYTHNHFCKTKIKLKLENNTIK